MRTIDNVKLGAFVIIGVLGMALLFYFVSKKNVFWNSNIELKAQFKNVQGLQKGNNVRYGGMHIGTVKDIYLLNDSTIEVLMDIDASMQTYIHKNSVASITTDGFVGDKLVNLSSSKVLSPLVESGDLIASKEAFDADALLQLVDSPQNGMKSIMTNLNMILKKVDNSNALWKITSDEEYVESLKLITKNLHYTSEEIRLLVSNAQNVVGDIKGGKGIIGTAINDTSYVLKMDTLIGQTSNFIDDANKLLTDLNRTVNHLENDINNGNGIANKILKDSTLSIKIDSSLTTIEQAAASFTEVMDALKKSFLLRKQMRKIEKTKQKSMQ